MELYENYLRQFMRQLGIRMDKRVRNSCGIRKKVTPLHSAIARSAGEWEEEKGIDSLDKAGRMVRDSGAKKKEKKRLGSIE